MALTVVSKNLSDRAGTVIIQGNTFEEVQSSEARALAIKEAGGSISRPGTSGSGSPYPVDADGNTSEEMLMGQGNPVAAYRIDINIQGGL